LNNKIENIKCIICYTSMQRGTEYVPGIVYGNLPAFIKYRGITTDYKFIDLNQFSVNIRHFEYIYISGKKDDRQVYILLMSPGSKFATRSPEFTKLLKPVISKHKSQALDIIIISEEPLTNHIKKAIANEFLTKVAQLRIENHTYDLFKTVVPEHVAVPKHEIASKEEVELFCRENYTDIDKFPMILAGDPMAVWIGARSGDVVKITRTSESAGIAIIYRRCITGVVNQ